MDFEQNRNMNESEEIDVLLVLAVLVVSRHREVSWIVANRESFVSEVKSFLRFLARKG